MVGVPERLGGKPRENADDAFATFMDMGEREWLGLVASLIGGGMLQPAEMEGFTRACDARAERNKTGPSCAECGAALTGGEREMLARDTDFVSHGDPEHLIRVEPSR